MAVQISKSVGARVIATAGSEEKTAVAKMFGANECVSYSKEGWWNDVLKWTGGKGVDVVFDPAGMVDKSLKCLTHQGRILVVGFASREGELEKIAMNRVLLKQASLIGYVCLGFLRHITGVTTDNPSVSEKRTGEIPVKQRKFGSA